MSILDKALETFKEANKINYYTFYHLLKEGTLAKILPLTHLSIPLSCPLFNGPLCLVLIKLQQSIKIFSNILQRAAQEK